MEEIIDKILNGEATIEDLFVFTEKHDSWNYRIDNSFEKRYDKDLILKIIDKYEKREIDGAYLLCWSNAYTFLIMNYVWTNSANRDLMPIEVLQYCISNVLDDIYYVGETESGDLEQIKHNIFRLNRLYDLMLNENVIVYFSLINDDLFVLYICEEQKKFGVVELMVEGDKVLKAKEIDFDKLKEKKLELVGLGYKEI